MIVGGGVGGLMCALALARSGVEVTVLDREELAPADDVEAAFRAPRRGAPQVDQTHGFLARLLVLLRDRFPDVLADLEAAGGFTMSMTTGLGDPQPGDDDLRAIIVRRSTFEWVLRRSVEAQATITLRPGTGVSGLVTSGSDRSGRPIVAGVRLEDGTTLGASTVIASTGSRSDVVGWLAEVGVDCPERVHPSGFMYLTRWYRVAGPLADQDPKLFSDLHFLKLLVVPGDGDTLSVTLAVPTTDRDLRDALSDPGRFDTACRLLPGPDRFFADDAPAAEPIGGVRPMAGLLNRIRRFTDDHGQPTTVGFHVIGDAHTTTNPLYGRGCSLAAVQAVLLADAHAAHPDDPVQRAVAYEEASRTEVQPWFVNAVQMDALGSDPGGADGPDDEAGREAAHFIGAMFLAGEDDPLLGRALAQFVNVLRTPGDLMSDPEIIGRLTELAADPDAFTVPTPPGPTREELLDLLRAPSPGIPATPTERHVSVNGVRLRVVEAGPVDGPPVVLAHGFPELSRSWRHQIRFLAAAGHRVIAPDQRGYGGSSRPEPIEDYDILHLTDDLIGLLDEAGLERAAFVGHDWGSMVVGTLALLHPERVTGVLAMGVPLLPRGEVSLLSQLEAAAGDSFLYLRYFQEPGVADADLGRDPRATFTRLFAGLPVEAADEVAGDVDRLPDPVGPPPWLDEAELDHVVSEFTRTGFTGALNWYRNLDRNWERTAALHGQRLTVPSAFVAGRLDPIHLMFPAESMDGHVTDHRFTRYVEGAGHWVQQEKPDDVNALLLRFLASLDEADRSEGGEHQWGTSTTSTT